MTVLSTVMIATARILMPVVVTSPVVVLLNILCIFPAPRLNHLN